MYRDLFQVDLDKIRSVILEEVDCVGWGGRLLFGEIHVIVVSFQNEGPEVRGWTRADTLQGRGNKLMGYLECESTHALRVGTEHSEMREIVDVDGVIEILRLKCDVDGKRGRTSEILI